MVATRLGAALDSTPRPAALIPDTQWQHARALAREFAPIASSYYLECRLGAEPDPRLDLLVGISRGKRQALSSWLEGRGEGDASLRRLSAAWATQGGPISETSALWLEYDSIHPAASTPTPSVCACVVPGYGDCLAPFSADDPHARRTRIITAIETLAGRPSSSCEREALERCAASLPQRGRIIHVSVMRGREAAPIKLYCVVPREQLLTFLGGAGWCGPMHELEAVVERYCPSRRVADALYVDVTLSDLDTVGGNLVGLTFTPQHVARSAERDPSWRPLLDDCVRAGLCTPEQRDTLARWPIRRVVEPEHTEGFAIMLEQWLDLKLVWSPTRALALKAYLGASTRWATMADRLGLASREPECDEIGASTSSE